MLTKDVKTYILVVYLHFKIVMGYLRDCEGQGILHSSLHVLRADFEDSPYICAEIGSH